MLDKEGILDKIQRKVVEFKACFRTGRYREAKNIYDDLKIVERFVELDEAWKERIFGVYPGMAGGLITEYEGVHCMEILSSFLIAVMAGVVCHLICKWLDSNK